MIVRKSIIILLTLALSWLLPVNAAVNDSIPRISLITCHAGSDVYELCGHTALRVQMQGRDIAVNYGLFDFESPNFVYRFVKGETDYRVGAAPFEYFLRGYMYDNRRVVEQELNLTPAQTQKVCELLSINLLPENQVYRYNYVKNNCATRPIDIIEQAIDDTITFAEPVIKGETFSTFREEMRLFHRNYPWYQFGIDLALGKGIDYKLPLREKMFAPEALEQMMSGATIADSLGNRIPAVIKTEVLNEGNPNGAQLPPTDWFMTPMAVCCLLLAVTLLMTIRAIRRKKTARWVDSLLFTLFGLMGCLLTFLIFVSVHEATSPNWLYLWINPLALIAGAGIWLKKCKGLIMCYHFINFVTLIGTIIAWNWLGQSANAAFIPLILCSLIRSANYCYINKCAEKKTA